MKLYHVSRNLEHIDKFVPRIPKSSLPMTENRDIKRICLSEHIELCLGAISYNMDYDLYDEYEGYKKLRVYEFEIDEADIIKPEEVSKYVLDATTTREYWYTKGDLIPDKSYLIQPTFFVNGRTYINMIEMLEYELLDEDGNIIE